MIMPDGGHSGLLLALWLDPNDGEVLAIPGGTPPEELHLTLKYGGDASLMSDLELAKVLVEVDCLAKCTPPIIGTVSGLGRFVASPGSDNKDVLYASFDSPELPRLQMACCDILERAGIQGMGQEHGFTPHITLAYLEPGADTPIDAITSMVPRKLRLDRLVVGIAGRQVEFELSGMPMPGGMGMPTMPMKEADGSIDPSELVTVEEGGEVVIATEPVELDEGNGLLLGEPQGASAAEGRTWRVLLIREGTSSNGIHYSEDVLRRAAPLFEGVKAYADHPSRDESRSRPERSVRDVVGWYDNVVWSDEHRGLAADFHILESAEWLRKSLKSSWDGGRPDLLGFSISAAGTKSGRTKNGGALLESIDIVRSTDVVTTPGAGGRLLNVLESSVEEAMDKDKATEVSEAPQVDISAVKSELLSEVRAILAEALSPKVETKEDEVPSETEQLREAVAEFRREQRKLAISARIDAAELPASLAGKLKTRLLEAAGRREIDDAEVDAEIAFTRELIQESGKAVPNWDGGRAKVGDDARDKHIKALTGWFKGEMIDGVTPVRDLRESYGIWNGQSYLDVDPYQMFADFSKKYDSGRDHVRLQESLGTSDWGQVFADVFYLQMIASYRENPDYGKWRNFVSDVESVPDFRTRHWTRIGGYSDFTTVAERATYPTISSPGDEELTYTVQKYGGIDDISMEMILGDRLNVVRRLPSLMAYAASRTLYKFVLNLITTTNPTMDYDSVALYDAAHGNTATDALSVTALNAVRVAMRSQTAFGATQDILGTRNKPRWIIIPNELEALAQRVLNPSDAYLTQVSNAGTDVTLDPQMFKGSGIDYHVYDELTDATDWFAVADPNLVPTMVMGFLNGRQEPELFTQDTPTVGSVFTADKISYKLRFVFGGDVIEHRSFYRNVAA